MAHQHFIVLESRALNVNCSKLRYYNLDFCFKDQMSKDLSENEFGKFKWVFEHYGYVNF